MTFEYISVEDAMQRNGLRMVVVGGVPSAWGEAAKGILHIKGIDWAAVRLVYDDNALLKWAGQLSGPVAIYEDEVPRSGWAEILLLAERILPTPSLIPADPEQRVLMFGMAHEFLGDAGLGWSRRLQMVHAGLNGAGGFPEPVARFLAGKYGYSPDAGAAATDRVLQLLAMFAARLKSQRRAGSPFYIGSTVSAVDIYSATCAAFFKPLPQEQCAMHPKSRAAFNTLDERTQAALDPILFDHRDMMYEKFLELPLSL